MRPGRKKKLDALVYLDNFPNKKAKQELMRAGCAGYGVPFISKHVLDDAKTCVQTIQESMPPGIYTRLDSFLLAAYGMAWALHKRAAEEIAQPRFKYVGTAQSPWIKILNEQAMLLAKLGDRLGLDPVSRSSLNQPDDLNMRSKFHGLIGPVLIEQQESSSS